MVRTDILKEKKKQYGIQTKYIVDRLGISRQAYYNRLNGKTPFKLKEVQTMCEVLHITSLREKNDIFFSDM